MDVEKEPSIYMRFHVTLEKAITFCKQLYQNALVPGTETPYFNQALATAGLTEDILSQDYIDYHLTWLTGVLCDTQSFDEQTYFKEIEGILSGLQDVESMRIQKYVQLLTYRSKLARGQQYKEMLNRVSEMDVIPSYIMIFRLYSACQKLRQSRDKITKEEYDGFTAYAYLFWYRTISKHMQIGKNIRPYIKDFFRLIDQEMGGMSNARKKADHLFKGVH